MQEIVVKNYKEVQAQKQGIGDNTYFIKPIVENIDKCSANIVVVESGCYAYGYHYHEENEEIFYIISGEAEVKTEQGNIHLKEGDVIGFPANTNGTHVITNSSKTEKLIYLDFGTANRPDVVHFSGTPAGMVITKDKIYNISE